MSIQRWIDRGLKWCDRSAVYVFLFLPILVVIVFSFNEGRHVAQITGFSLRWYEEAWTDQFVVRALRTSLTIAIVSAALATVIGTLSAIAMNGGTTRGAHDVRASSSTWPSSCRASSSASPRSSSR